MSTDNYKEFEHPNPNFFLNPQSHLIQAALCRASVQQTILMLEELLTYWIANPTATVEDLTNHLLSMPVAQCVALTEQAHQETEGYGTIFYWGTTGADRAKEERAWVAEAKERADTIWKDTSNLSDTEELMLDCIGAGVWYVSEAGKLKEWFAAKGLTYPNIWEDDQSKWDSFTQLIATLDFRGTPGS